MEQYIPKSILIEEIEKIRAKWFGINNDFADGQKGALTDALSLINTLNVKKEVDLEKLINDYFTGWYFDSELDILAKPNNYSATIDDVKEIAKHFFELGIFSQLTWKDIKRISEIGEDFMNSEDSDNLNDEEYYTEILNRFKAQKGEEV